MATDLSTSEKPLRKRPTPRSTSFTNRKAASPATESQSTAPTRLGYSVAEVARRLGASRSVVYQLIADRKLLARKLGRKTVLSESDIADFVRGLPDFNEAKSAVPGQRSKP